MLCGVKSCTPCIATHMSFCLLTLHSPLIYFNNGSYLDMFSVAPHRRILNHPPPIPTDLTRPCRQLLKALLQKFPERRLGYDGAQQVKNHAWFKVRQTEVYQV